MCASNPSDDIVTAFSATAYADTLEFRSICYDVLPLNAISNNKALLLYQSALAINSERRLAISLLDAPTTDVAYRNYTLSRYLNIFLCERDIPPLSRCG